MKIIRGKLPGAKKIVIYGPEGIGKTTFASRFPDPLFIDTEGSTKDMDVARLPEPSSWQMILDEIQYVKDHPDICKTLVIDTVDWAEQLCIEHICSNHNKKGIEDFGYGNGYVYAREEFGRFLNRLSELAKAGIHVVLTAHAQIRKFEQPDELGAYDRYELKLGKKTASQTSPLVKEWADMVLFANYKIMSVAADKEGKKHKAQGGRRVMYTSHHPCWDAKNRYGLPDEMEFNYSSIAYLFEGEEARQAPNTHPDPVPPVPNAPASGSGNEAQETKNLTPAENPVKEAAETDGEQMELPIKTPTPPSGKMQRPPVWESDPEHIPKALRDLMELNEVSEWDIQMAVSGRGYYPSDVPIERYDPDFIDGVLIGAWEQVLDTIKEIRKRQEIPFH